MTTHKNFYPILNIFHDKSYMLSSLSFFLISKYKLQVLYSLSIYIFLLL